MVNAFDLQAKMQALRKMGADLETRHLAVVLMYRRSKDGWVHDLGQTLATETGVGYSTFTRAMRWLRDRNVVEVVRFVASDGPRGSAWRWSRRVRPMKEWKGAEELLQQDTSSPEELLRHDGRAATATRHISSSKEERESRAPEGRAPSRSPSGKKHSRSREKDSTFICSLHPTIERHGGRCSFCDGGIPAYTA